uniref:Coiled-coil domain-containing protein n=1 Tax=Myoviridae sp. ct0f722 TaxID=2827599 RepID=A0A8S5LQ61_9CAUD|nr:MAG TPA: coiled-coil domain-containing protein [Myoviridae sp. ct0f722]
MCPIRIQSKSICSVNFPHISPIFNSIIIT